MATDAERARLGVTGALRVAALGTTSPTGMETWPAGWEDLGYISDDGISESRDENTEQFIPWQEVTPIRVELTSSVVTFSATLWESNFQTISLFYRKPAGEMTTDVNGVVSFTEAGKPERDVRAFGIDIIDGVYQRRIVLPYAEVTDRGDLTYQSTSLISYEVTITAYPGSDGVSVRRMFNEGWTVPA